MKWEGSRGWAAGDGRERASHCQACNAKCINTHFRPPQLESTRRSRSTRAAERAEEPERARSQDKAKPGRDVEL